MSPLCRFVAGLAALIAFHASAPAFVPRAVANPVNAVPDSANTGTIHGRVLVEGKPAAFANVVVLGTRRGALSDERGEFRITRVPAGAWALHVALLGYAPTTTAVAVRAGRDTAVDMVIDVPRKVLTIAESPQRRMRAHPVPDCDAPTRAAGDEPAEPDTSGWWTASGSIFDFALPTEFRRTRAMGIDSEVAAWVADSSRISYDLGDYTACADPGRSEPGMTEECWRGYRARIRLSSEAGPGRVNVEVCFPGFGLGLYGSSPDPAERARILTAFRTIRFRDHAAPTLFTGPPAPYLPTQRPSAR